MLNEARLRELARDAVERGGMTMKPRRERGLWSFLTWSFFLAQLAAGNAFAGGAAQAANNAADLDHPEGSSQSAATGPGLLGRPDFLMGGSAEPQSADASSATAPVQTGPIHAAEKTGGIEQLDVTSDAGLVMQSDMLSGSTAFVSIAPAAEGDGGTIAAEVPAGVETAIDLPQVDGVPPLLSDLLSPVVSDVLPPVLETIDNLVDNLGSTLDDLFVPVVGTVDDLAEALGPTLDLALSPVEAIADNIVGGLEQTLDPVLTTVAGVTESVGDILEPVGGVAGELIALADPVLDTVAPLITPVSHIVAAAEPLLDPVLDVAAPAVDLVEPVVEPLLQPLAPALAPVLEILPLNAATGDLLDGLIGGGETDAVGSPGGIALAVETEAGAYDLMEAGAYTELGITLHETPLDTAEAAGDLIGNVAAPISDLLDSDHDGNNLPGLLGHLQHEVALRGLGEGLI